jgi:HAE1 family hydrophobic/amphiphilic exporter-1
MSKFFIRRPIVAIVIAILTVIAGAITLVRLPVSLFPSIAPPEVQIQTTFVGADAQTVEQSVATPIEQQLSGVDNSNYLYSVNSSTGEMRLIVDFDVKTDPNTDLILSQLRLSQAASQLPTEVTNFGVTVQKTTTSPMMLVSLYSPTGVYDSTFLANYAYINLYDQVARVPGVGSVQIFGAGRYAMRLWVHPDQLAQHSITVPEIVAAIQAQNTVNPAGQIGGEPIPKGQDYTYSVRAQGRLITPEDFEQIVVRAAADGGIVRLKDVARIELGAQDYSVIAHHDGKPSAIIAVYQLPGSNAVEAARGVRNLLAEQKARVPKGVDYSITLDTTRAVTEGIKEIVQTLVIALVLVIIVVYLFLQGWRATLIPLLAVPVSLVGTFVLFPVFGFSINTLSLFGLVLAIGLVVDDAIVVVEAVEHHIEEGMPPRDATLKAMEEISDPSSVSPWCSRPCSSPRRSSPGSPAGSISSSR